MDELLRVENIAILVATVGSLGTVMYLYIAGEPVPNELLAIFTGCLGYWTGKGREYFRMRAKCNH